MAGFTGGKEGTLWYYRALVEAYARAGVNPVIEELDRVMRELEALAHHTEDLEEEEKTGRRN